MDTCEDRYLDGEQKRKALTGLLNTSITKGGEVSEKEIDAALEAKAVQLVDEGL
ncbi:hypothetical protein N182_34125 [Sinorhizobium sp. GL2]|nr:hypothetical protein N182_34125 [Sinorhizobium sp. GL2]